MDSLSLVAGLWLHIPTMTKLGVAITAATVTILVAEWLRCRKRALPLHGWLGLAVLGAAEWLMFRRVEPVATYFTPIAWTAYILLADAAVFAVRGGSRLADAADRREFARIALLSIPLWLIFEAYNLRLANWTYVGVPENWLARWFGYAWSFATITPGIFVTADLVESFGWFAKRSQNQGAEKDDAEALSAQRKRREEKSTAEGAEAQRQFPRSAETALLVAGALCLVVPVVAPREVGAYLFGLVWLGFIFLLDPVNARLSQPSLFADLVVGNRARFYALLISGWVCGWLWEFWNFWATAKWIYIFPIFQDWKIFEMPAPGYLGFLPFALECFVMYIFADWALNRIKRAKQGAASSAPTTP